jgi:O-antigen ligase
MMNTSTSKPLLIIGLALTIGATLFLAYRNLEYFGDIRVLGGILLIEILVASIWNYSEFFFAVLMIAFVWAGIRVPLNATWTSGRWVVLAIGAGVGFIVWLRTAPKISGIFHPIAFFCICAAFVSCMVSQFVQMSFLKALSLALLFLYCATGARASVLGREDRFFRQLVLAAQIAVVLTAILYLGLGSTFFGNPNSLGAAMSVLLFPILLWGWFVSQPGIAKTHRLIALLLCVYLVRVSMARAGMVAVLATVAVFCLCLHQYKLLLKIGALTVALIAVTGMLSPRALNEHVANIADEVLYKGHKEGGVFGSRRSPWNKSVTSIKEHPWFGTGYGTSPTGEDPGLYFGTVRSSAETAREHGSSYITIAEWVGMLGALPFLGLLVMTVVNVWKVCTRMWRTGDPRHYSIPVAMVVLAGLVHAGFEDWLFAAGSYLCLFFWFFAFLLPDYVAGSLEIPILRPVRFPQPTGIGATAHNPFAPNRVVPNR